MSPNETTLRCAFLRAKGFYVHLDEPPPPTEQDTGVFWCTRTQAAVGPDDDAVSPRCCGPGRNRFDAVQD